MILINSLEDIDQAVSENDYVLLFVGDSACSTSRALDNKIEDFSKKNPKVKVLFTLLEALPLLASRHMIFVAPAVILFHQGKEIYREGRFVDFEILENFLN